MVTAGLGTAINLATDWKTNWIAWLAVAILVLASVLLTVRLDGRTAVSPSGGTTIDAVSASNASSEAYGLVMRTSERTNADGSSTKTVEYFSEEVAVRAFREDFGSSRRSGKA